MLSAVSQQIQTIQLALKSYANAEAGTTPAENVEIELLGRQVKVHPDMAIFVTMNPGYGLPTLFS